MLKSKTVLGIDIGSVTIKMVEMENGRNGPVLLKFVIAPISGIEKFDDSDDEKRIAHITALIKTLLKEKKFKSNIAAVSISSRSVFTRFVKMPFSDLKKLDRMINFEAQQQIPFPLEVVSWDYQIVGKNQEEEYEVLIAAIKQDILNKQFQSLNSISLTPMIFDVGALATYNSLLRKQISVEENIIILDLGANPAVMIIHQPNGYWVRTLSYSSISLSQTLMRQFNISYEEAESLKFNGYIINESAMSKMQDDINFKINCIITQHAKKLYTEIMRSLNFYRTQFVDIKLDRIILCGGGCRLDNIKLYLSTKLKLNVEYANPLQDMEISKSIDLKEINDVSYLFCESIGLG
ncbi:hypothetical protein BVX93_00345, partial [bacterium B13(2017)]